MMRAPTNPIIETVSAAYGSSDLSQAYDIKSSRMPVPVHSMPARSKRMLFDTPGFHFSLIEIGPFFGFEVIVLAVPERQSGDKSIENRQA